MLKVQVETVAGNELQMLLKTIRQATTPDRQTVEVSCRSATTAAKTAAITEGQARGQARNARRTSATPFR
jgi:hypothetical protein